MYFTEGVIVAIQPEGFRIAMTSGAEQDIYTMTPGPELDVSIGDHVRVTGGPDPRGGFATSSIYRKLDTGETEDVPDAPGPKRGGAAVQSSAPRPSDFRVLYQNYSPPLPPPHSVHHSISIGPGPFGVVVMNVGDPSGDWREDFPLADAHLDWLFTTLRDAALFHGGWRSSNDVPVGGGAESLTIVAAGQTIEIPPFAAEEREAAARAMFGAVRALMPPAIWDRLNQRRAQYVAQYNQRGPDPVPATRAGSGRLVLTLVVVIVLVAAWVAASR